MSARVMMDKNGGGGLMKTTAGIPNHVVEATANQLQQQQQHQHNRHDWSQQQQQQNQNNGQQQNLLVVSQDAQGKELLTVADEQASGVNVVLDSYC